MDTDASIHYRDVYAGFSSSIVLFSLITHL